MDFKNTKISYSRPLTSYEKIRSLIAFYKRNRRSQFTAPKTKDRPFLDIGCGPNMGPAFVNLDYGWRPGIDIVCDITKGLPFPSERFEGIFTEHCLEHIPFKSTDLVLQECHRILKPGSVLRIIVPDGELYTRHYIEALDGGSQPLPYSEGDSYEGVYSPIMSVNRIFRSHGHLFIYDFDTFGKLLEKNGFTNIEKSEFGKGREPKLVRDTENRRIESLYVEAEKPA